MAETNFRIFNTNFLDEDVLANFSFSSEQSAFQAENILNFSRRSKVWRSNGYYVIDSSNRNLVFRETTGVDLTALLNVGIYSSTSSFMTELARALNSTGGSAYTVAQSGLRFQFTSDGAGGTGIFELRLTGSTVASLIGLTSNKTGSLVLTCDLIIVTSEEWLEFDFGVSSNPDAFFMVDQRNQPFQVSGTIRLQGNETGNFSSPSYNEILTANDEVYYKLSDNGLHSSGLRYWRIKFEKTDVPTGYFQLGAAFLGNYWKPASGTGQPQFPLNQAENDRSTVIFSEGGQNFADERENTRRFDLEVKHIKKEAKEELETFWNVVKKAKNFFVSMDSDNVFSTDVSKYIILCKFASDLRWSLIRPNNWTLRASFREEL